MAIKEPARIPWRHARFHFPSEAAVLEASLYSCQGWVFAWDDMAIAEKPAIARTIAIEVRIIDVLQFIN